MKHPATPLIAVVLSGLLLAGCAPEAATTAPIPVVYVTPAQVSPSMASRILSGSLRPRVETDLGFRVAGLMLERRVDVGSVVQKGDVLARLDSTDHQLALEAAEQEEEAARVDDRQQRLDAQRLERLALDDTVGRADAERQRTRSEAAAARLKQAGQQRELQRNRLAYTQLVAPFDGVVTAVRAERGQVLGEGIPVLTMARAGELEVVVDVPEGLIHRLRSMQASVQLTEQPQEPGVTAPLREVAAAAHPASRTYRVRYAVPQAPAHWRLGMSAMVVLTDQPTSSAEAAMPSADLPVSALVNRGNETWVWVVDGATGQLTAQPVQVQRQTEARVRVTGVPPGALVVSVGAHKLDAGMRVRPVKRDGSSGLPGVGS